MYTYEDIKESQNTLIENWGEAGEKIVAECWRQRHFDGHFKKFLSFCTACGGNWGGMLLSGIKELYEEIYNLIPDNMGNKAMSCVLAILVLLNVDCSEGN